MSGRSPASQGRAAAADAVEPISVVSSKASIPNAARVQALAEALRNFPANGKPPMDDLYWELRCLGFIEEVEIRKPCRNCGTALTDYRYMKITAGGRAFAAAALAKARGETA